MTIKIMAIKITSVDTVANSFALEYLIKSGSALVTATLLVVVKLLSRVCHNLRFVSINAD
ncbi:hypothetical protein H4W00_001736 [Psychrobacter sp. PL19]